MLKTRGIERRSLRELGEILRKMGFSFGMRIH
jgi:hypothetical protein